MDYDYIPLLLSFAISIQIYLTNFSANKHKHSKKPFITSLIIFLLSFTAPILMALYASNAVVLFIVYPLWIVSLFTFPIYSSRLLVRIAPEHGNKRRLVLALGVVSSVLYTIVLALALSTRTITEANL